MTLTDPRLIATLREMAAGRIRFRDRDAWQTLFEMGYSRPSHILLRHVITPAGRAELARIDKEAAK